MPDERARPRLPPLFLAEPWWVNLGGSTVLAQPCWLNLFGLTLGWRGDPPRKAARVEDARIAMPVGLVLRRALGRGPRRQCPRVNLVHVLHPQEKGAAQGLPLATGLAQQDQQIA